MYNTNCEIATKQKLYIVQLHYIQWSADSIAKITQNNSQQKNKQIVCFIVIKLFTILIMKKQCSHFISNLKNYVFLFKSFEGL